MILIGTGNLLCLIEKIGRKAAIQSNLSKNYTSNKNEFSWLFTGNLNKDSGNAAPVPFPLILLQSYSSAVGENILKEMAFTYGQILLIIDIYDFLCF